MSTAESPRMTESRKAILEELRRSGFHPTADELHERVRLRIPRVSLGTIYRNLEYLANYGLVTVLRDPDGRRRYDAMPTRHCHVWCVKCGRVQDVGLASNARPEELLGDDLGFEIDGYDLSFLGTCPSCRSERKGHGRESRGGTEREARRREPRGAAELKGHGRESTGGTELKGRNDGTEGVED